MSLKGTARDIINKLVEPYGYELTVRKHDWENFQAFLPFKETLKEAEDAGLSVADYVDQKYNKAGATQETVDGMVKLRVFDGNIRRICEIGPGSGRYLEKVIKLCTPEQYEIYETATEWAEWLVKNYNVVLQPTDGETLASTPSDSVDLVHAHKVFVCLPFLTNCRYLEEMIRVVRGKGKMVFDIVTEDCMDNPTLESWRASGIKSAHFPSFMSKQFTLEYVTSRGFSYDGSFIIPMKPGKTECFVFTRK